MQDPASELPRIPLLRASVNKGEGGQGPSRPLVATPDPMTLQTHGPPVRRWRRDASIRCHRR
jgi:hypothetical protein